MNLNDNTKRNRCQRMSLNDSKERQSYVILVKQEEPESYEVHLKLIQSRVEIIKSETIITEDQFQSANSCTLEPEISSNRSLELKLEMLDRGCDTESNENISIKEELLHEDLDIKIEDETNQEFPLHDKYNSGIQLPKQVKVLKLPGGEKPFKCSICDYSCNDRSNCRRHLIRHTREKPFKCNICKNSFVAKSSLKVHLRTHTGEKPFKCNICDFSCRQESHLKLHLRTHSGEKPYKCNVCDNSYTRKTALNYHLETHTAEKRFKCKFCDYKSSHNNNLKSHLRTHTEKKPYKCNICDCSCGQNFTSTFKNHLKCVSGETPFKCNICDYSATQKTLKMHLQVRLKNLLKNS